MSTFDYNVDNYTITELFAILDLDDPDSNEIMNTTNKYITQFSPSNENQPQLVKFFQSIQTKLLRYMQELETSGKDAEYTPNEKQTNDWWKNQALPFSQFRNVCRRNEFVLSTSCNVFDVD